MKKWQLGICITCAAVLAGMFLFNGSAQAAGMRAETATVAPRGRVESFDIRPAANCLGQQPLTNNLLHAVEAERLEQGARLVREAAEALKQGAAVIVLPGRSTARLAPALITAVEE